MAYPIPIDEEPTFDQLEEWEDEGVCEATDGCRVEIDGVCLTGIHHGL